MIAGVCGGLARYFGIDPIIVRIGAIALAFAGGAGLLAYAAAWLLVPREDGTSVLGQPPNRSSALTVIGGGLLLLLSIPLLLAVGGVLLPVGFLFLAGLVVWWLATGRGGGQGRDILRRGLLGVGLLILCFLLAIAGGWAAGVGGGGVVAALVIGAGAALVLGSFVGGARWLILPALAVALSAGFVQAAGIKLNGGLGQREYRPLSAAAVQDHYRLGAGRLVVDLRAAHLPPGDRPLKLDVGIGEALLVVPRNVCVVSKADIGIGATDVFGHENGGVDVSMSDTPTAPATTTRLIVDAHVGVGAFEVRHRRGDQGKGPFFVPEDSGPGNAACTATSRAAA